MLLIGLSITYMFTGGSCRKAIVEEGFPKCRSILEWHLEGTALSVTWWGTLGKLYTFSEAKFLYLRSNLAFLTDLFLEFTKKGFKGKGGVWRTERALYDVSPLLR